MGLRISIAAAILLLLCTGCTSGPAPPVGSGADPAPPIKASPAPPAQGSVPGAGSARAFPEAPGPSETGPLANTPPEIRSLSFVTVPGDGGDGLAVEVAGADADGDEVSFEISWVRNGEPAGEGDRIAGPLLRGDRVAVSVTPSDGKARGRTAILERQIRNRPPRIEGATGNRLEGSRYTCRVRAVDPDGDPLSFGIDHPPPGMSIDPSTGRIDWSLPDPAPKTATATVTASDGMGGTASWTVRLSVREDPAR